MEVFSYYFWTFILGSILGVAIETLWCILKYKKIESRKGLIYGPFNPLYGCATFFLSLSINCVGNHSRGNIFLIGVVVASTIEYLCSYYQEKVTGSVSWNYDKFRFNLNGRINLVYSIFWGILTLFWYEVFMPIIDSYLPIINRHPWVTIFAFIFIIIDCIVSLVASIRRMERRKKIRARTKFEERIDELYDDERMKKIYPNSEFIDE